MEQKETQNVQLEEKENQEAVAANACVKKTRRGLISTKVEGAGSSGKKLFLTKLITYKRKRLRNFLF